MNYGRISKKCECIEDAVWVDVGEIERKLRGDPTEDEYEYEDEEMEDADGALPTPPESVDVKPNKKRKRLMDGDKAPPKRIRKVKLNVNSGDHVRCSCTFRVVIPAH